MSSSIHCQTSLCDWIKIFDSQEEVLDSNVAFREKSKGQPQTTDVYGFAPCLVCPDISLRNELELTISVDKKAKAVLKPGTDATHGKNSKVKMVHFKNDPDPARWFAIKTPLIDDIYSLRDTFFQYCNNFEMTEIGDHPNFMKVHALFIKMKCNKGIQRPYLVLDDCQGPRLCDIYSELQLEEVIHIITQLKTASLHLYDCDIIPGDFGEHNILITKDNIVKLIDYDLWLNKRNVGNVNLARLIYEKFNEIVPCLASGRGIKKWSDQWSDLIIDNPLASREDLEKALDAIIAKFHEKHEIEKTKDKIEKTRHKIERTKNHIFKLTQRISHRKTHGGKKRRTRNSSLKNEIAFAAKRLLQLEKVIKATVTI